MECAAGLMRRKAGMNGGARTPSKSQTDIVKCFTNVLIEKTRMIVSRTLFMKITLTVLSVAALAGSVASAAEISGKIKVTGTPPPEKQITLDPLCGKFAANGLTTRHYVVGADKGLANVFVYVKEGAKPTPAS